MWKYSIVAALALVFGACSHNAPSGEQARTLEQQASATLAQMRQQNPNIDQVLQTAAGYAVFPSVGAAGALFAGGAFGKGILFEHGQPTGYVELKQGNVGFTLGGKSFSQILILRSDYDVARLKSGKFEVGANAGLVVLTAGAQTAGTIDPNTTVIVEPKGGLMADITVSGQTISYSPLAG